MSTNQPLKRTAFRIKITGLVQGVGFRPFVYRLSTRLGLCGFVRNQRDGVTIHIEGTRKVLDRFVVFLSKEAPPASEILRIKTKEVPPVNFPDFRIVRSQSRRRGELFVPPDIASCPDCLSEMEERTDRRFQYPFINCTNCGPRYSIISGLPYDRSKTAMSEFQICGVCRKEYLNPADRRYHAEPIACPVCGPEVSLRYQQVTIATKGGAVKKAVGLLRQGRILAVKGIGGFHIICDAHNETAVRKLRERKNRPIKPLALMAESGETIARYALFSPEDRRVLSGPARPILLLSKKKPSDNLLAPSIAPDNNYYGFFLPYAPLHFLLFEKELDVLVATSANLSEEPIICDNDEAEEKLSGIADYFLVHNRRIINRCDDSIFLPFVTTPLGKSGMVSIRRSRGYAPLPILTGFTFPPGLSFGAEEKGTFALAAGNTVFLSTYLGDLKNYENQEFLEETLSRYQKMFGIQPKFLVADLHPDYRSRRLAEEMAQREKIPLLLIQHHKAHVASVIAEKGIKEPIIGVAFDGTGYGEDGSAWGGEFFVGDHEKLERAGFFLPFPLPGGDLAVNQPWRTGLSLLYRSFGENIPEIPLNPPLLKAGSLSIGFGKGEVGGFEGASAAGTPTSSWGDLWKPVLEAIKKGYPFPVTSSAGRLFDGVSAILGLCYEQSYEAEAPVRIQTAAEKSESENLLPYPFVLDGVKVDWRPIITGMVTDLKRGVPVEDIANRFHLSIAEIIFSVCQRLSRQFKIKKVVLSGGVFQNRLLLSLVLKRLSIAGFEPVIPERVPINDSGVCLGQLLLARSLSF
ncbi:MAG: carbamoyltransferase HypF [Candidatus Omnitrophota bacterium]